MAHVRFPSVVVLALLAACGGGNNIEPPPVHATKLALTVQPPAQAQSGIGLTPAPAVQLQDDQGAAVAQAGVPVTVAIASGGGSLTGSATVNTSAAGLATFSGLSIHGTVGSRTLVFTAPDLAGVTSGAIDLGAGAPAVITALTGDQQTAGPGTPVATPPGVTVTDGDNNPVASVAVGFQVTAGGGAAEPGAVNTDPSGHASVTSWTLGPVPGPNTLTATAAAIPGASVVFTATGSPDVGTISGTISLSTRLLSRGNPTRITTLRARGPQKFRSLQTRRLRRTSPRSARSRPAELIVTYRAASLGAPRMGARALASRSLGAAVSSAIRAHIQAHLSARASAVTGVSPSVMAARIRVPSPGDVASVAAELRRDPAVASVEPNGLVFRDAARMPIRAANDRFYPEQAWHYGLIDLPEAWAITTGSSAVLVGVVDDGIRFDHPDITGNLTDDGYDFVSNDFTACSGDGVPRAGDGDGYDPDPTVPAVCDGGADSIGGHGLHVAGTIGAVGNDGLGATGINWTVRIRPVRVLDIDGAGTDYDVAQGILYAAGLPADDGKGTGTTVQVSPGARVINLSLGGPTTSKVIHDAVIAATNAGALIVAAAGNDGTSDPQFPAAFPEVLSVSAVGPDGELASYSSFGPTIGIAAPGGDFDDGDATFGVLSLIWDFKAGVPAYAFADGTSMATPHVTGVAALLLAQNPGLTAAELRSRLTTYAVDAGSAGRDDKYGAGIVNARNSLTQTLAPTRQLFARLYDAATGGVVQTVAATTRAYAFSGVTSGSYEVYAGEDEDADQAIGIPGRRWGAFGGTATPSAIEVNGAGTHHASFSVGRPAEQEPNDRSGNANLLVLGGYLNGDASPDDKDSYRVLIPQQGQYTFETSAVDGACGFALEEDTVIGVFDTQGILLGSNDDINQGTDNLCSRVTLTLAPGRYRVEVQGLNGGAYRLQARAGP